MTKSRPWSCALAVAAGVLAGGAWAQPTGDAPGAPSPDLVALSQKLASEDARERIAASERLREDPSITLRQIETLLTSSGPFTAEQRQRLLSIAWDRFRTEPRPAMGIQTSALMDESRRVILQGLPPGFPAASVLRVGDWLESADGIPLTGTNLRPLILSHDPGDTMKLRVIRDGAVLEVSVRLGRYADLTNQLQIDSDLLWTAWSRYRARTILDQERSEPLASPVAPAAWAEAMRFADDDDSARIINFQNDDRIALVVGGEARGGTPPPDLINVYRMRRQGGIQFIGPNRNAAEAQNVRAQQLLLQRQALQAEIDIYAQMAADNRLGEDKRKILRDELTAKRSQLQIIDQELLRMRALVR
jgi:hypothetical protein